MNMRCIDKVALIYLRDGKILGTLSKGKTIYYIPGGKREPLENDMETLHREIEEELSVSVEPKSARYYGTFTAQADGKADGLLVKMTCYEADVIGEIRPSSEIAEVAWLSYGDMDLVSPVDKLIFQDLREKGFL